MPSNSLRNVTQIVENSKNFIDILDSCTKFGNGNNQMTNSCNKFSSNNATPIKSTAASPIQPYLVVNRRGGGIKVNDLLKTYKDRSNFDTMGQSGKSKSKMKTIEDKEKLV